MSVVLHWSTRDHDTPESHRRLHSPSQCTQAVSQPGLWCAVSGFTQQQGEVRRGENIRERERRQYRTLVTSPGGNTLSLSHHQDDAGTEHSPSSPPPPPPTSPSPQVQLSSSHLGERRLGGGAGGAEREVIPALSSTGGGGEDRVVSVLEDPHPGPLSARLLPLLSLQEN